VAYEASSHGLSQFREGLRVVAGGFTNLSRDHLDYHETMEAYFAAKMRLFDEVVADGGSAVVWADDAWSEALAHVAARGLTALTVGEGRERSAWRAAPHATGQVLELERRRHAQGDPAADRGLSGGQCAGRGRAGDRQRRRWRAHARCALAAATGARAARTRRDQPRRARRSMSIMPIPPMRSRRRCARMWAAADHGARRGGDRDSGKRGPMGAAACAGSDVVIVTDDNPRGEDPAAIRAAVMAGCDCQRRAKWPTPRRHRRCREPAGAGDIVLVAGKGHEQGQIVGRGEAMRVLPFDDVQVARECVGEITG
jgi:UDP-N-acetylmuramoyl-L-alanyl-D-glutamate--2,6-diaminopimelate ligase